MRSLSLHKSVPVLGLLCTLLGNPCLAATPEAAKAPAAVCKDDAGWDDPAMPRKVFGNTWYVGTCGITALLITSPEGHVLIDSGTEKGGRLVAANIQALGFDVRDVRHILISHEHNDHSGGLSYLQNLTKAKVYAMQAALSVLQSGRYTRLDPQLEHLQPIQPVANLHALQDGQVLRLSSLQFTAHATPGHTPGGSSWTWQSCEGKDCRQIAYVDSLTAIKDKQYRFSDDQAHPGYLAAFRQTISKVAALPCDILLTPHPQASDMWKRLGPDPKQALLNAQACRQLAEHAGKALQTVLDKEKVGN